MFDKKGVKLAGAQSMTLIGEDAVVHGTLCVKGSLRVEGMVEGDIADAVTVEIGKKGRVKGNVAAEAVSVAGLLEGDVLASRHVEILAQARLAGNIRTRALRVEDGAFFEGSCSMRSAQGEGRP